MREYLAVVALILALGFGMPVLAAGELPNWEREPAGWKHKWAGLFFPSVVGDLRQGEPRNFDSNGHNSSIGYNAPQNRLAITVFVYENQYGTLKDGLRQELAVIKHAHPKLELGPAGKMSLPWLGADPADGVMGAYFQFEEKGVNSCSFLILAPVEKKLVKVRATWHQSDNGLPYAMERIKAVLKAVKRSESGA